MTADNIWAIFSKYSLLFKPTQTLAEKLERAGIAKSRDFYNAATYYDPKLLIDSESDFRMAFETQENTIFYKLTKKESRVPVFGSTRYVLSIIVAPGKFNYEIPTYSFDQRDGKGSSFVGMYFFFKNNDGKLVESLLKENTAGLIKRLFERKIQFSKNCLVSPEDAYGHFNDFRLQRF